jgi:hypothetical protein
VLPPSFNAEEAAAAPNPVAPAGVLTPPGGMIGSAPAPGAELFPNVSAMWFPFFTRRPHDPASGPVSLPPGTQARLLLDGRTRLAPLCSAA